MTCGRELDPGPAQGGTTRRDAVGRAALRVGGAVLAAGALGFRPRPALAQVEGDAAVVASLTGLEMTAVAFYDELASRRDIDGRADELVRLLRDHEQQHLDALLTALEALGGARPAPPRDARELAQRLSDLGVGAPPAGSVESRELLELAVGLEEAAIGAYHDAVQRLQDAKLLQTAVSIMASEGQHAVALRRTAGLQAIATALPTGRG